MTGRKMSWNFPTSRPGREEKSDSPDCQKMLTFGAIMGLAYRLAITACLPLHPQLIRLQACSRPGFSRFCWFYPEFAISWRRFAGLRRLN
jgi:hypothetical protein